LKLNAVREHLLFRELLLSLCCMMNV